MTLFERDAGKASGLSMIPKLTYEHVHLTSFSKMRVDLAAQVSIPTQLFMSNPYVVINL